MDRSSRAVIKKLEAAGAILVNAVGSHIPHPVKNRRSEP
jgi:predicted RNA binding protein YcfA (HicA-like mRNA interferase family)